MGKPETARHAVKTILCLGLTACLFTLSGRNPARADDARPEVFAGEAAKDYLLHGVLPGFQRELPLAEDDPLKADAAEDAVLPYRYGLVYRDINDYYAYDKEAGQWRGSAPEADPGLLVGGNAFSRCGGTDLDDESNDFASVLPYASLSVITNALAFDKGKIEYTFYTDDFNLNVFEAYNFPLVTVNGENTEITKYKQMTDDVPYSVVTGEAYLKNLSGVIYSGGIRKTIPDGSGHFTETCVTNENGVGALFSVRFKNAVTDEDGTLFDLVLTFTRITFAAESEVTGPFSIMEGNKLFLSPLLYRDGEYLVNLDEEDAPPGSTDAEGVRIGAKYEFDYSIEDGEGNPAEGLLLFSVSDLDSPSMSAELETDAQWGTSAAGTDFQWAEGVGIVDGAAAFAVTPYYNHIPADGCGIGDGSLLHVSRMEGIPADGTANGLMFSAGNTGLFSEEGRDDENTFDTGFATLLTPNGSMVVTMSADRRESVNVLLFSNELVTQMKTSSSGGGSVYSLDYSLTNGGDGPIRNEAANKVIARGSTIEYVIEAEKNYAISTLEIDGQTIPYHTLRWEDQTDAETGAQVYVSAKSYGNRFLTKDENGAVHIVFEKVSENHSLHASFVPGFWRLPARLGGIRIRRKTQILMVALASALVFVGDILWMARKKTK